MSTGQSRSDRVLPTRARRQGIFWSITIPRRGFTPPEQIDECLSWIRGQLERGHGCTCGLSEEHCTCPESRERYEHWQIACAFKRKQSLRGAINQFGTLAHCELSRSAAIADYVWKEDTRIEGTQFELGAKPIVRASKPDWESVWVLARERQLDRVPAHIRVVNYRTLLKIAQDHEKPTPIVRDIIVYWGSTGVGKSRRAWEEAGPNAYPKDPMSKFWCGYDGEEHVVIDEFRGDISISHVLRWGDRYPIRVEVKGSSRILLAKRIWITSNLSPEQWYPGIDSATYDALKRRMTVVHLVGPNDIST